MKLVISSLEGGIQRVQIPISLLLQPLAVTVALALRVLRLAGLLKKFSVILFFQEYETCVNLRRSVVLSISMSKLKGISGKLR